jgi:hypothetical protein
MYGAIRTTSFALILKGAVGGSITVLALFGVTVPYFGIESTTINEGLAAGVGAVLGIVAAIRG